MDTPVQSQVWTFPRDEFISSRWDYRPGEHVTFVGKTGYGKTTLAFQLLNKITHEELPGVSLVMKPKDETIDEWTPKLDYKIVDNWPPPPRWPFTKHPRGYMVWPRHTFDPNIDDPHHHDVFRRALLDSYKRGNRILFGDELYSLAQELRLPRELVTLWTKGRSMGTGLWGATQKPTHVPLWAYNQASHLFLSYEGDHRHRQRFGEISGVDRQMVSDIVSNLKRWQWLYIKPDGPDGRPAMCIVERD